MPETHIMAVPAGAGDITPFIPVVSTVTPTTGQTVVINSTAYNYTLNIEPATDLAALTITLPTGIGQRVTLFSTKNIGTLTINGAASILNSPGTMLAGTGADIVNVKTSPTTWSFL